MNSEPEGAPGTRAPITSSARVVWTSVLILLSVGGIAVMQFFPERAILYWLVMVPVFGVVSAVGGRSVQRHALHPVPASIRLRLQFLHWLGLLLALLLVFLMRDAGTLVPETAGLTALLLLALTCFLAGVHFDWHFLVLGTLLGLTVAGGVLAEQFFWVLMAPAVIALVVVVIARRR